MLIIFCIWYLNFKGGQLYPVPPSYAWLGAGCSRVPVGPSRDVPCAVVGHRYFVFDAVRGGCRGVGLRVFGGWGVSLLWWRAPNLSGRISYQSYHRYLIIHLVTGKFNLVLEKEVGLGE